MSTLIPFAFEAHTLRIADQDGAPWFVLKDLLAALGTTRTTAQAVRSLAEGLGDGYTNDIPIPDRLGRPQPTTIVAEPGATFLVSRSNTDQGRRLNRFIHTEVLPTLRRHGTFSLPGVAAGAVDIDRLQRENSALKDRLLSDKDRALDAQDRVIAMLDARLAELDAAAHRPTRTAPAPLTPAEHQQIITLLAEGLTARQIAKRIGRSAAIVSMLAKGMAMGAEAQVTGGAA